jgi:hypothetical protein
MRFYSCDNKDFCLLGYDAMQVMNGGRHLVKDREKNRVLFFVEKNLHLQMFHK